MSTQRNSISFLRAIAALTVFLGHAATHLQVALPKAVAWFDGLFEGVPIFFMISGFLIWKSLSSSSDFKTFALKRILRLYPELWCAVGISVISLLVLYREYLQPLEFVAWIFAQSTLLQFWTPDCLRGFGCATPNGALWTVGVMVQTYIVVWLLFRFLHGKRKIHWLWVLLPAIGCNAVTPLLEALLPDIVAKLYMQTFLPYLWIFLLGAFISENADTVLAFCKRFWYLFLLVAAVFEFTAFDFGRYGVMKILFLTPALLGFAYQFPQLNIPYDITYGVYLYHMVVINVFITLGLTGSCWYILLAFLLSVGLATLSYVIIGRFYRNKKKKELQNKTAREA